jgi:hypothetical protein
MENLFCRPVSLTNARNGKRIRLAPHQMTSAGKANKVRQFQPGDALLPVCEPMPILGYRFHYNGHLTVYVAGTMPADLRTAVEEDATHEETWLTSTPGGLREIDLSDSRNAFRLLPAPATGQLRALFPPAEAEVLAA